MYTEIGCGVVVKSSSKLHLERGRKLSMESSWEAGHTAGWIRGVLDFTPLLEPLQISPQYTEPEYTSSQSLRASLPNYLAGAVDLLAKSNTQNFVGRFVLKAFSLVKR